MGRHPDRDNMPGTLGADLMLTFGDVRGARLSLHVNGEEVVVDGAKTVLADFLNEHEVSVLEGDGLRVVFVFWQQRQVVHSDHVVHALGAPIFPAGWKRAEKPPSHLPVRAGDTCSEPFTANSPATRHSHLDQNN